MKDGQPEGDARQRPDHTPTAKQTRQKKEEALWKFWRERVLRSGRQWKFSKAELCAQCKLLNAKLLNASRPSEIDRVFYPPEFCQYPKSAIG